MNIPFPEQNPIAGWCGYGSHPSVSVNGGEFLDQTRDYHISERTLLHISNETAASTFFLSGEAHNYSVVK